MPELPEVETVRRGLSPALEGRTILRIVARRADLRAPFPENFESRMRNRRVEALHRRGKYLLADLDDAMTLIVHLGMSGRMMAFEDASRAPPPGPHDHVDIATEAGGLVRFRDPRRFGLMTLAPTDSLGEHPFFVGMGPEPLSNAFDGPALAALLKGRKTPLKAALLDQGVVAGLGNIYVSEALFRARLSPRRLASSVGGRRADALADAIRQVLAEAIEAGGSTLRDHAKTDGSLGYFQHRFAVYDREGRPCPECDCANGVTRIVQAGRSTFFCARKQR